MTGGETHHAGHWMFQAMTYPEAFYDTILYHIGPVSHGLDML